MSSCFAMSVSALLAMVLFAGPASAAAPKFHSTSSSVDSTGALSVSFDERGLGNGDVDYLLTGDVDEVWACINRGGKNPSAANKQSQQDDVTEAGTFEAKNGRIRATLTTDAPTSDGFACPPGQRLVLASVSYTNLVLTDETNDVSTSVPDASRTFFDA